MNIRPPIFLLCLLAGMLTSALAGAEAAADQARQDADWAQRLADALLSQQEAANKKAVASSRYEQQKNQCFSQFRVSDCQNQARQTFTAAMNEIRQQENNARTAERQVKKEQLAAHNGQRLAEAEQRAESLVERQTATSHQRQQALDKQTAKISQHEQQALAGERRKLADDERQARKQAEHAARVAQQIEKSKRNATQAAPSSPK